MEKSSCTKFDEQWRKIGSSKKIMLVPTSWPAVCYNLVSYSNAQMYLLSTFNLKLNVCPNYPIAQSWWEQFCGFNCEQARPTKVF